MYGGLQELTNALSNSTIPDPLWPPLTRDWGFATQLYPLLSPEQVKLRTSNLARTFTGPIGPIRIKAHEKFGRKRSVGVSRDCPNFQGTPSQERVKLRTSTFVRTFIGSIGRKAHENVGISSCGHSAQSGSPENFQGTHVQRALRSHLCDSTAFLQIWPC